MSDINEKDKMKFQPVEKITAQAVIDCLEQHIVDSQGTIEFLRLVSHLMVAFMDNTLTPLQRVYNIW